jgi:hypothetical protein
MLVTNSTTSSELGGARADEEMTNSTDDYDNKSSSNSSHTGSSKSRRNGDDEDETCIKAKLAKQETNKVDVSRALVLCILVLSATAISIVVYYISRNAEIDQVNTQYEGVASKVLDSFQTITNKIGTINSISVAATGHGIQSVDSNSSSIRWPFITLPSFEQRSTAVRALSSSLYLAIHPIVTDTTRDDWERYVVSKNNAWM